MLKGKQEYEYDTSNWHLNICKFNKSSLRNWKKSPSSFPNHKLEKETDFDGTDPLFSSFSQNGPTAFKKQFAMAWQCHHVMARTDDLNSKDFCGTT